MLSFYGRSTGFNGSLAELLFLTTKSKITVYSVNGASWQYKHKSKKKSKYILTDSRHTKPPKKYI